MARRHRDARRGRQERGRERRVPGAARQGQRRARLRCVAGSPRRAGARLPRARAAESGMLSNKALLGFGWASAPLKEPEKSALVPWTELAARRTRAMRPCSRRARACPMRYAELGAYAQSLERYQDAIGAFDASTGDSTSRSAPSAAASCSTDCSPRNPGEEMGWFWNIPELPRDAARAPPAPGAGAARVPGGVQELARPAVSRRTCRAGANAWASTATCSRNRRQAYARACPRSREGAGAEPRRAPTSAMR